MELSEIISKNAVLAGLECSSKKALLQELAGIAARVYELDEVAVLDVIQEREKLGSTGVGQGIAIPHGKVPGLSAPIGVIVKLDASIDFESTDDRPVDIVCLLLAPENAGADHLNALACVSRTFKEEDICAKVRAAKSAEEIRTVLGL